MRFRDFYLHRFLFSKFACTFLILKTLCKVCCYLWCKDTNFNANHNIMIINNNVINAVIYGAKILILMQITTTHISITTSISLLSMVQRY